MALIGPREATQALIEALGLQGIKGIGKITIEALGQGIPTVTIERCLYDHDIASVKTQLGKFALVEKSMISDEQDLELAFKVDNEVLDLALKIDSSELDELRRKLDSMAESMQRIDAWLSTQAAKVEARNDTCAVCGPRGESGTFDKCTSAARTGFSPSPCVKSA